MRLIGRNDTTLVAALIVGVFLLFREPFQYLIDTANDIKWHYHVDLLQGLSVLAIVFVFHQYRKRQEAKADLAAASAEAAQARIRMTELERLVGMSRSLAAVNDFARLTQSLHRYLPKFTQDRPTWLLISHQGVWDVLMRDTDDRRPTELLESVADRALATNQAIVAHQCFDGIVCFPAMVGTHPVGALLVQDSPALSTEECSALEAAAALVAIAVRNVQTLIEMREHGLRDGLTGCFNRAHALETLNGELRRARRSNAPLSLIMFDVDEFKRVNDSHGHLAGDHVLAEVGRRLGDILRTSDVKCRYGGDEFLIILPDTPAAGARQVAESIRQEMGRLSVRAGDADVKVSVSVGVTTAAADEPSPQSFIARADRALYRAKQAGRNRVYCADAEPGGPLRLIAAV